PGSLSIAAPRERAAADSDTALAAERRRLEGLAFGVPTLAEHAPPAFPRPEAAAATMPIWDAPRVLAAAGSRRDLVRPQATPTAAGLSPHAAGDGRATWLVALRPAVDSAALRPSLAGWAAIHRGPTARVGRPLAVVEDDTVLAVAPLATRDSTAWFGPRFTDFAVATPDTWPALRPSGIALRGWWRRTARHRVGAAPRPPDTTARQRPPGSARPAPVPRASLPRRRGARGALARRYDGVERATAGAVRDPRATRGRGDGGAPRLDGSRVRSGKHARRARRGDDDTRRASGVGVAAQPGRAAAAGARRLPQHHGAGRAPTVERRRRPVLRAGAVPPAGHHLQPVPPHAGQPRADRGPGASGVAHRAGPRQRPAGGRRAGPQRNRRRPGRAVAAGRARRRDRRLDGLHDPAIAAERARARRRHTPGRHAHHADAVRPPRPESAQSHEADRPRPRPRAGGSPPGARRSGDGRATGPVAPARPEPETDRGGRAGDDSPPHRGRATRGCAWRRRAARVRRPDPPPRGAGRGRRQGPCGGDPGPGDRRRRAADPHPRGPG